MWYGFPQTRTTTQRAIGMGKNRKRKRRPTGAATAAPVPTERGLRVDYERACLMAERGSHEEATSLYELLEKATNDVSLRALIGNDLVTLAVVRGDHEAARI